MWWGQLWSCWVFFSVFCRHFGCLGPLEPKFIICPFRPPKWPFLHSDNTTFWRANVQCQRDWEKTPQGQMVPFSPMCPSSLPKISQISSLAILFPPPPRKNSLQIAKMRSPNRISRNSTDRGFLCPVCPLGFWGLSLFYFFFSRLARISLLFVRLSILFQAF